MKVLFDDPDIIILDKPAGLATANSPRGDNSLYVELIKKFGDGCFVGVVSRLDKPVSGVVIFGKNRPDLLQIYELYHNSIRKPDYSGLSLGISEQEIKDSFAIMNMQAVNKLKIL